MLGNPERTLPHRRDQQYQSGCQSECPPARADATREHSCREARNCCNGRGWLHPSLPNASSTESGEGHCDCAECTDFRLVPTLGLLTLHRRLPAHRRITRTQPTGRSRARQPTSGSVRGTWSRIRHTGRPSVAQHHRRGSAPSCDRSGLDSRRPSPLVQPPEWPPIVTDGRQPDYLLTDRNTGSHTFRVLSLECKGSAETSTTIGQLARGVTQLSSLSLNGTTPQGIVVATVSNGNAIRYRAVDPPSDDTHITIENEDWEIARTTPRSSFLRNEEAVAIGASTMARGIRAGTGRLAIFSGNLAAARELLPLDLLEVASAFPRNRVTLENEHGLFRGVAHSFPTTEGPSIQVFLGVDSRIDAAMESGSLDALLDAQDELKETHPTSGH